MPSSGSSTPKKSKKKKQNKSAKSPRKPSAPHNDQLSFTPTDQLLLANTPVAEILSPFRPASTQWLCRYTTISFAVIICAAVGLGSFSGYGAPPMYGDFEAQRHWMEITIHLPIKQWYFYDLQWWGLDYPPLTAFHSYLLGKIGSLWNPDWFALDTSRGLESDDLKAYMRSTVIFSQLLVYTPGVLWFVRWWSHEAKIPFLYQSAATAAILFQPALILIDHGHFQYNSVMLGFSLLSIVNLFSNNYILASVFFVMSLLFKQMALYYSPAIFAYLLGSCFFPNLNIFRFLAISITTIVSFVVVLTPFYWVGGISQLQQIAWRVFPFARGLWEDKVSNLWCTLNTFIKLKNRFSDSQLSLISLGTTLTAIAPVMIITGLFPKKRLLPYSFSACSWAFFLFSFQVHEKSVLIPLMPTTLLLSSSNYDEAALIIWVNNIAVFSLCPLLSRDGLQLQTFVVVFLWNWMLGFRFPRRLLARFIVLAYYTAITGLCYLQYYPPSIIQQLVDTRYADLWVVVNVSLSFSAFFLFWLWTLYKLYTQRNISP